MRHTLSNEEVFADGLSKASKKNIEGFVRLWSKFGLVWFDRWEPIRYYNIFISFESVRDCQMHLFLFPLRNFFTFFPHNYNLNKYRVVHRAYDRTRCLRSYVITNETLQLR